MSSQLQSEALFESSFLGFFYRQWLLHRKPVPAGTDLTSQVAIITGSNSGLGLESGRQLLQLGLSHLILAVRSLSKGNRAADGLRKELPSATVSVWLLDMESYDSIIAFVEQCKLLTKVTMVILNAGLRGGQTFTTTKDTSHEYSSQVNYISTALLAILLLPVLKSKRSARSKPPVLTIVTSDSAFWTSIETQGPVLPQLDKADKLAEEVNASDVIVNMANPGLCAGTAFGSEASMSIITRTFISVVMAILARTSTTGASTYVDAVVVKGEESHGSYVSDWAIRPYRLWEETMEELNFARASDIIQRLKE
ncbi:retinol dehydrogenase 12 [Xylariaceae sp. FL1651]|nr:retinol dehydrogenase 12 [Xylariaceae sp. FL1651]